jgi:predicted esterase
MIPVERAQESRKRLGERGFSVTYREYEMEHGIGPEALRDLVGWLESKVLSTILIA